MILDVLIFTLGFLVAGLLALACLPAVWHRALRLSGERLSRLVPLSSEEIAAERDHLRAAHAVELRRTEQKVERSEADRAALRVEAARREGRILRLDDEAARAQVAIAGFENEVAGLRREVNRLWAESGAEAIALNGLAQLAETRLADIAVLQGERSALRAERDDLAHEVDRARSSVAGLEIRLVGADTRGEDLVRELARFRENATDAAGRIAALERELTDRAASPEPSGDATAAHAHEIEALKIELAFMSEQAASAERRATESLKAYEALHAARHGDGNGAAPSSAAPGDGDARLRAAIAALAGEVLRSLDTPSGRDRATEG